MADPSRPQLSVEPSFRALKDYHEKNGTKLNIRQMFKDDASRFQKFRYAQLDTGDTKLVCNLTFGPAFPRTAVKSRPNFVVKSFTVKGP